MDAYERLRSRISGFPGYSDGDDRRRSDGLIRSYFGEALALLRARLAPLGAALEVRVDAAILRAGFMNQAAFKPFEYAVLDGAHVQAMVNGDSALLDLGDRAATVEQPDLIPYLDEVDRAFAARDAAMRG